MHERVLLAVAPDTRLWLAPGGTATPAAATGMMMMMIIRDLLTAANTIGDSWSCFTLPKLTRSSHETVPHTGPSASLLIFPFCYLNYLCVSSISEGTFYHRCSARGLQIIDCLAATFDYFYLFCYLHSALGLCNVNSLYREDMDHKHRPACTTTISAPLYVLQL